MVMVMVMVMVTPSHNANVRVLDVGLKSNITSEGVWRIRKKEHSKAIELFKLEETGHGDILSSEFVEWRQQMASAVA